MSTFIITIFIGLFIIISSLILVFHEKAKQEEFDSIINNTDDFSASFTIKNSNYQYLISVDDNRRKILYVSVKDDIKHIFEFENVISVEILEDSNTTYSKSSARTIGGGLLGGIIGGGVGAIVGGLSGSSKGKKKIKEIQVKILLRNYSIPAIYIDCLNSNGVNCDSDSLTYKNAIEEARQIADKLSVIIDLIDRETKSTQNNSFENPAIPKDSVADELEKIYRLKEKGIISEEEYEKLKAKLL